MSLFPPLPSIAVAWRPVQSQVLTSAAQSFIFDGIGGFAAYRVSVYLRNVSGNADIYIVINNDVNTNYQTQEGQGNGTTLSAARVITQAQWLGSSTTIASQTGAFTLLFGRPGDANDLPAVNLSAVNDATVVGAIIANAWAETGEVDRLDIINNAGGGWESGSVAVLEGLAA